jgi:hypothetical protein
MGHGQMGHGDATRGSARPGYAVFITHNSEYHCRDGVCVGVRDRRTRGSVRSHAVVGGCIFMGRAVDARGEAERVSRATANVGDRIWFATEGGKGCVITSPVVAVVGPSRGW